MLALAAVLDSPIEASANFNADAKVPSAVTSDYYETMARARLDSAKDMEAEAQGKKLKLEQNETKSDLYGSLAQDLRSQAHALARKYERAAKANKREASLPHGEDFF